MMKTIDKLRECPFCGGENVEVFAWEVTYQGNFFKPYCKDCDFELKPQRTEEEAIKAWNRRKPMDRIVDQMERKMDSDLISRKALLELYDGLELLEDADWDSVWNVPLEVVVQNIKDMPTVDAEPVVHGEWIRKEYNSDYPYYRMECSNCGGRMPRDQMTKEYYSDYCQNCGAKMDGGGKER